MLFIIQVILSVMFLIGMWACLEEFIIKKEEGLDD